MGLDMYFYAKKEEYKAVSRFDESGKTLEYPEDLKAFEDYIYRRNFKEEMVTSLYQVGYFRKFNALHDKIVKIYGGGKDECQEIYLGKKGAENLLAICKAVSEDHGKAGILLPTADGMFFGGVEYDEWYFRDIDEAIRLFELILGKLDFDEYDFVYRASW